MPQGALAHLKVLLNYSANLDPFKNMRACEDFFLTVLHAHVLAAADYLTEMCCLIASSAKEISKEIIIRFVNCDPDHKIKTGDKLYQYSIQALTLGLVWHGFNDVIKEKDGDRILIYWKFLLAIFEVDKRQNNCKEAINLFMQFHFLLPKRLAEQLKWSRYVNTRGVIGGNIPTDLHLEHLNRHLKDMLPNLMSNITFKAINPVSRSLGIVHHVCEAFEHQNNAKK